MKKFLPLFIFLFIVVFFFNQVVLNSKLPIPTDTIVGLYHPYRDVYAKEYPRGIPFKNFLITDPVRQQYPWKKLAIDTWKTYQIPVWNPYNFSGTPLLANFQSAVFYPFNFILFLLPFYIGWSIFIFLQPLLALCFMYLFLRNLRLSMSASILGSLSFAFCGFFISWMEWGNVVHTGLWLPLILFATDKIVSNNSKKIKLWYSLLFFTFLFSFLGGHLQIFFYEFIVSLCYFLFRWYAHGRHKKKIIGYAAVLASLLVASSVQLYPLFQFISLSARDVDQVSTDIAGWYIPWQHLVQFIAPDFFGNPSTLNYWGIWNYGEFIGYIGFIPLLFALNAIFFKRDKTVVFFTVSFLCCLLFALPTLIAKIPFILDVPFLSTSQPTRLLYVVDISLSILAAFGFEFFFKAKRKIYVPFAFLGVIFLALWAYVLVNPSLPHIFQASIENISVTKNNLKLPTVLYVACLIIVTQFILLDKKLLYIRNLFIITVLVITAIDLFRFSSKYLTFADRNYLFPQTKILSYMQNHKDHYRVMATDARILPPNFSIIYKIHTTDGYDPLFLRRYAELIAAISRNQPNINPPFGFNRIIILQNYDSELIHLMNIKYVLSMKEINSPGFKKIMQEGETLLYENRNVFPRTFFVKSTIHAAGRQDAVNKLFGHAKDLRNTAIVEDAGVRNIDTWSVGKAYISRYDANDVVIKTENLGEGFLVLTDSFYPSWRAEIDGNETKIYLTDYNFRGIIVPKGEHVIRFYATLF